MRARIQKISKYAPSIFQGRLNLASANNPHSGRSFSLTIEHSAEPMLIRILIASLALLACAYIYFVGSTILNVVATKDATRETARLTSAVAGLEREYFAASHKLGPDDGERLGLAPVSNTIYIHRPGNAAMAGTGPNGQSADKLKSNEI